MRPDPPVSHRPAGDPEDLCEVYSSGRVTILASRDTPMISLGSHGAVIGHLYPRHGPARRLVRIDAEEAATIGASRGQHLISSFWGGYVAMITDDDLVRIVREPSGAMPCYYMCGPDLVSQRARSGRAITSSGRSAEPLWTTKPRMTEQVYWSRVSVVPFPPFRRA